MIEAMTQIYPGIWALVERMLPTYPKHAARRADEMRELEQTAQASGIETCVIGAVARMHEMLADASLHNMPHGGWTVAALVRELAASGMLTVAPRAAEETHTAY
jgi:hypothetical protein